MHLRSPAASLAGAPGVGWFGGFEKGLLLPVARPLLQAAASGCLLLGIGQRGEGGTGG
jgi:hypothetical protein